MRHLINADLKLPGRVPSSASSINPARLLVQACPRYRPTPLAWPDGVAVGLPGVTIAVKDESGRFGLGSFKALGGIHAVLRTIESQLIDGSRLPAALGSDSWLDVAKRTTFTCATDGNHGRAVAAGARLVGSRCVVFVHESVASHRVAAITALGAEVRIVPGHYDAAVAAADSAAHDHGWVLASDTSYPGCETMPRLVVEGYSVLVDETLDALAAHGGSSLTHVFVQAGVGGLAAAVASRMRATLGDQAPALIVVEPDAADCLYQTAANGGVTNARGSLDTAMAMLACREPSHDAWAVLKTAAAAFMTVSDREAELAVDLLGTQNLPTSPSGAAGLAGLIAAWRDVELRSVLKLDGAHVLVIATEGPNHEPEAFLRRESAVA